MAPDAHAMRLISRAAFEVDDYERIVHILHHRSSLFFLFHFSEKYCEYIDIVELTSYITSKKKKNYNFKEFNARVIIFGSIKND